MTVLSANVIKPAVMYTKCWMCCALVPNVSFSSPCNAWLCCCAPVTRVTCTISLSGACPVPSLHTVAVWLIQCFFVRLAPQWGAADAEIKVPSGENTELKRSPFKAWSRLVYHRTCYAYCQGFRPCLFPPFRSIHLHFFKTSPDFSCIGCG